MDIVGTLAARRKKPKKKKPRCTTKKVRLKNGRVVRKKVCKPVKKKPVKKPVAKKLPVTTIPTAATPPMTVPTGPVAVPPQQPPPAPDPMVHGGAFGVREAERLLWRAGFGPRPGDAQALAALGLEGAVRSLTRPAGAATLVGPAPTADGSPLAPGDQYAHDHLFWLDRMVRSDQQLVERMALVFHDWFGLSDDAVGQTDLVLGHIDLYRSRCLGSFRDLLLEVTRDPAMLLFLNGANSDKNRPNENYGREIMELFSLGADRGAYTEDDVRQAARALTGWRADYVNGIGWTNFRYEPSSHDSQPKIIFGRTGNFDWRDVVDLCINNPYHRSFFVLKLWSYFVPVKPDAATQAALEQIYVQSDWSIRAVLEAILRHPAVHTGPPMVKPPVVFSAGLLRARSRGVTSTGTAYWAEGAGQRLFKPPNVSGWNDNAWLDTSTLYARWRLVYDAISGDAPPSNGTYSLTETAQQALDAAVAYWNDPPLRPETRQVLLDAATAAVPASSTGNTARNKRAQRQTSLRHLIAASPDLQVC